MDPLAGLTRWVLGHRAAVLIASVLVLAPAAWIAAKLGLESSFTALLPEHYQAVRDLHTGIEKTGGSAFAVVAIDARDRAVAERFADALHPALEATPVVRFVQSKLDVDFLERHMLLYLDEQRLDEISEEVADEIDARTIQKAGLDLGLDDKTAERHPERFDLQARFRAEAKKIDLPIDRYMVGKDGRYLYVFAALKGDTGDIGGARVAQALLEKTSFELRERGGFPKDLELRFSGSLVIRLEEDGFLTQDLQNASLLGFVAVVLLLVLYTRRPRALLLFSAPLFAGLTLTFAFAYLAIGRLNIISGFLATILSGLGIEFGIHLFLRHMESRGRGKDAEQAQIESMSTTGRSLIGSAFTNAGGFFVVAFAGFEGFREFGIIAGTGMLLTLAITLLVFPALNVTLEKMWPMRVKPIVDDEKEGLYLPGWIKWPILIGMPLLFLFSIFRIADGDVRFRTNWREIKGKSPASDFDDYIIDSLGGSFTQSLILVWKQEDLAKVESVVERVIAGRKAAGQPNGITGTLSLADLVPATQAARFERIQKLGKELARVRQDQLDEKERESVTHAIELTQVPPFAVADVPASLRQRFQTVDGKGSLLVLRTDYLFYESSQVVDWANQMDELRAELQKEGLDTPIISENWIAGTVFKIIIGDGPFILIATLLVVFLVILIDFRSLSKAGVVLGSLVLGQVCIAGGMAVFGLELNFINVVILPIVVGVSVDNAVHIYHRYLEEGPGSIPLVLRYTASATTLSSATNLMGFGAMIVAHHAGLRSVAQMAIVGVLLTFVSTSVFFPLLLGVIGERRLAASAAAATSSKL